LNFEETILLMAEEELEILEQSELSLLETLDHVLNRGLVIAGEITISVADIDLIFVGLNILLTSTETAREVLGERGQREKELESRATDGGREPEGGNG
jgi:hypothetical protein